MSDPVDGGVNHQIRELRRRSRFGEKVHEFILGHVGFWVSGSPPKEEKGS